MTEITKKLKKKVFNNDVDLIEHLWRITHGDKTAAYRSIRLSAKGFGMTDLTDLEIDTALAELNDGIVVDWAT
jgi:hypothetical protein